MKIKRLMKRVTGVSLCLMIAFGSIRTYAGCKCGHINGEDQGCVWLGIPNCSWTIDSLGCHFSEAVITGTTMCSTGNGTWSSNDCFDSDGSENCPGGG